MFHCGALISFVLATDHTMLSGHWGDVHFSFFRLMFSFVDSDRGWAANSHGAGDAADHIQFHQ